MKNLLGGFCKKVKEVAGLNDKEENKLLIRGLITIVFIAVVIILVDYILKSIPVEVYVIFGCMMLWLVFRFAERLSQTPWPDDNQVKSLTGTPGWHKVLDEIVRPVYAGLVHRGFIDDEVIIMGCEHCRRYCYARIDDHKMDNRTIKRKLERRLSDATGIPLKEIVEKGYVSVCHECVCIYYDITQK